MNSTFAKILFAGRIGLLGLIVFIIVAGPLLLPPMLGHAAGLVPCGNGTASQVNTPYNPSSPDSNAGCNFAAFVVLVRNLTNFLIFFSAIVFVIVIMYVGIRLLVSRGDPGTIKQMKEIAKNTVWGFIFILAGWLIVHAIAGIFLNPCFNQFLSGTTPTNC